MKPLASIVLTFVSCDVMLHASMTHVVVQPIRCVGVSARADL